MVGDLAADAAIGADALDLAVDLGMADALLVDDRGRHQGAGRAGLDALAAGDAGAGAHRVVHVEHDLGVDVAERHADHVVDLDLAAGAHAQIAVDAGVEMDRHRRVARVGRRRRRCGKRELLHAHAIGPLPELGVGVVRRRAPGWSASSSSMTIFRAVVARSEAVTTFMPGEGLRMQDAASTRSPSISTMQARQLPSAR